MKSRNLIVRLLRRQIVFPYDYLNIVASRDAAFADAEAPEVPTICKRGRRYRARLRNGRWETMGGPIGNC